MNSTPEHRLPVDEQLEALKDQCRPLGLHITQWGDSTCCRAEYTYLDTELVFRFLEETHLRPLLVGELRRVSNLYATLAARIEAAGREMEEPAHAGN